MKLILNRSRTGKLWVFVLVYFLCSSGSLLADYWYPFKHLSRERYCERKVFCPGRQRQTEQCSHAGLKAGPLDLEMSAITMRPLRLTQFLTVINEHETIVVI